MVIKREIGTRMYQVARGGAVVIYLFRNFGW
jgi:hypothetical protein